MHESNWALLWLPVNWVTQLVIVSDHQTNSHSYDSALAPFSSGAVPPRPLKAKELTGQGFKPISSFSTAAITTGGKKQLLVSTSIWGGAYSCWLHICFFQGVTQEWQRRIPIKLLVTFLSSWSKLSLLTIGLSLGLSEEHLVSVVKPDFKSAFISRDKENIIFLSAGHLGHSPG